MDRASLDGLRELALLREEVDKLFLLVSPTLRRFSRAARELNGIPRDFWVRGDRPGPQRTRSLCYAFDVWHAMVQVERVLKELDFPAAAKEAADLVNETSKLTEHIDDSMTKEVEAPYSPAALLLSDDIFGTFSMTAAAAVLRAEAVPERFNKTPSYLAGYVLFGELALARKQAEAYAGSALTERAPRLTLVADAVDAVLLFSDHLDRRQAIFRSISQVLEDKRDLEKEFLGDLGPGVRTRIDRLARRKLQILFREAERLIRVTRSCFGSAVEESEKLKYSALFPFRFERLQIPKNDEEAKAFADKVVRQVDDLLGASERVLKSGGNEEFLRARVRELRNARRGLVELHRRWGNPPTFDAVAKGGSIQDDREFRNARARNRVRDLKVFTGPSIHDYSRIRFLGQLEAEYRRAKAAGAPESWKGRLKQFVRHYTSSAPNTTNPTELLEALGESVAARNLLESWAEYLAVYREAATWIDRRSASRLATERFLDKLSSENASEKFKDASKDFAEASAKIREIVLQSASWSAQHAKAVLLEAAVAAGAGGDPTELSAGLFLAARMGRPWPEELEQAALRALEREQRADGGFHAYAPLTKPRGLAYFAPSVQTIGLIFKYLELTTRH